MVDYRNAVAADADDVMKFWTTAAEDSHRPPDSADAVLRLIERDPAARQLVALAEDRFTSYGGTRADAMVLDGNTQAHHIWTTAGYAPQPEWSRWVKPL